VHFCRRGVAEFLQSYRINGKSDDLLMPPYPMNKEFLRLLFELSMRGPFFIYGEGEKGA